MSQHPYARLTPRGWEKLVSHMGSGAGVAGAAHQMGASCQAASRRLVRARHGEPMSNRSDRSATIARLTPPDIEERVHEAQ